MFLALFLLSKQVLMQTASQEVGASADPGRDGSRSPRRGSPLTQRACVARRSTGARDPAETCDRLLQGTGALRAPFGLPHSPLPRGTQSEWPLVLLFVGGFCPRPLGVTHWHL